jgi:hypothetical protein
MLEKGTFVISLDFELHWGCFETMQNITEANQQYFYNTRKAIPEMLSIFSKGGIHATWAAVGMLFCNNKNDWENNQPEKIPVFKNPNVSAYKWVEKNGFNNEEDPFHFAPSLIKLIQSTPHQEIGTHTFAHYFCLEEGQQIDDFRADIKKACEVANRVGVSLNSLVFPRNQFNESYLSVCKEFGINAVRSNPDVWYWSAASRATFMEKLFRSGDAYIKLQPIKMVFLKDIKTDELPLQLPASRLYRAWRPKYRIQNKLKMKRILDEMTAAAKKGGYYHLWWHPHNFGYYPAQCLEELTQIVNHFNFLKTKYGFESLHMKEVTDRLIGL